MNEDKNIEAIRREIIDERNKEVEQFINDNFRLGEPECDGNTVTIPMERINENAWLIRGGMIAASDADEIREQIERINDDSRREGE